MMKIQNQAQHFADTQEFLLSEDELECIQGGFWSVFLSAASLAVGTYTAFTTPEERMAHRAVVGDGLELGLGNAIGLGPFALQDVLQRHLKAH